MNSLCRILIVDDESILRNGLKHICDWENEGFILVGEASNGQDALTIIEKEEPNIVITDVVMPVLDGVELSKEIESRYPDIKVLILSSFSEFDYIKETFKHGAYDYLLKPKVTAETLLSILKKMNKEIDVDCSDKPKDSTSELKSRLIHFLYNKSNDEVLLQELKSYFDKNCFLIMKFLVPNRDIENKLKDEAKLDSCCENLLNEYKYVSFIEGNEYVVIINIDSISVLKSLADRKKLAEQIKKNDKNVVFVGSDIIEDISLLPEKSNCISELLNKTFYFSKESLINEDIFKESNYVIKFNYEEYNNNLIGLDFEACKNNLLEYFIQVKNNLQLDEYSFKKFCQNIIYNTLNTIDELDFDVFEISRKKMKIFKCIDLSYSYEEISEIVSNFIDELSNYISREVDNNKSTIINKVKQYIEKNYYRGELSLTNISQELHIDYYYLSFYFKSQTNENLSAYINKVRIDKAKIYLADNTIPISKISEMVGFSEHNYFSKIFKKQTNLTPSEYRKRILK